MMWFVERILSLAGGCDAVEMSVPSPRQTGGHGRSLMLDLVALSERLKIQRDKVHARKIGRHAWLRMGFVPDEQSWRDMRGGSVAEPLRVEQDAGSDRVAGLVRQIVTGPPDTAGVLAALTDPVPIERGRPVIVPLGRSLSIDAVRDWSGESDANSPDARLLARTCAGGVPDER